MEDEQVSNLPPEVRDALHRTLKEKHSHHGEYYYAGYFRTKAGSESMIYMQFPEPINDMARELLEIFSGNVAISYDALLLRADTARARRATISILGGAIEKRNSQASLHLQHVGHIAGLLAEKLGQPERDVELLQVAASLHDVGKACIPDSIVTKPAPLDAQEWELMKTHAQEGYTLLSQSASPVHALGATIALEHHERWDGSGYPKGLRGDAISQAGRIVAVADVLDSLLSASCYKKAWPMSDALQYLREHAGTQFDPALVALLLDCTPEIDKIYN
jgi:response regulator RpfG family c-di-GMP phosphodiesterase